MKQKAIETRYNGFRFRSRLEARWAVFFDALGIKWDYELEGYVLDGRAYLPDFVLPNLKLFVEVKPSFLATGDAKVAKDKLVCLSTTHPAILVCGDPGDYRSHWFGMDICDGSGGMSSEEGGWDVNDPQHSDSAYFKVDCLGRPSVELGMMARSDREIVDGNWESIPHYEYPGCDEDTLNRCAMAARAARFEFKGNWKQKKIAR